MNTKRPDLQRFNKATRTAARFVYDYLPRLILISVLWVVTSLPIVTMGISTLGAYTAVVTIREQNRIDWSTVRARLIDNGRDATLLAPVPVIFLGISMLYFTSGAVASDIIPLMIAVIAFYLGMYLTLLFIPTFVMLAHGLDVWTALSRARSWLGSHSTLVLSMAVVTAMVFVATALFTITFPLLFGGIAFSFHAIVIETTCVLGPEDAQCLECEQSKRTLV